MRDCNELPIPDWGLLCPACKTPLAGMREHRCAACGALFSVLTLLGRHRPIPDIGLICAKCGYSLTGLDASRCPECGMHFSVRDMLEQLHEPEAVDQFADPQDHFLKRREPVYTGAERPLPDFGLYCRECGGELAGAAGQECPFCGQAFVLTLSADPDWVNLSPYVPPQSPYVRSALYAAQVPYMVDSAGISRAYGDNLPFVSRAIRVPREFFFDALAAVAEANRPPESFASRPWFCPNCNEKVPAGFEICWSCGSPHPETALDNELDASEEE